MKRIVIEFKDGTKKEFLPRGRAGGSYSMRVSYQGEFVVDGTEAFPAHLVKAVKTEQGVR